MTENGSNGAGASHLDWLRARHEAITADRTLDLEVPGYQGRLVVRYGRVPWATIARAQDQLANPGRDGQGTLFAQIDFIIAACREVLVRDAGGELVPVDPSGKTRRFDADLAHLFGAEVNTARETVRYVFGNDPAVATHAGELLSWTVDTDADVQDEFMGESAPVVK
jgi:hypothetical protein